MVRQRVIGKSHLKKCLEKQPCDLHMEASIGFLHRRLTTLQSYIKEPNGIHQNKDGTERPGVKRSVENQIKNIKSAINTIYDNLGTYS